MDFSLITEVLTTVLHLAPYPLSVVIVDHPNLLWRDANGHWMGTQIYTFPHSLF